MIVVVSAVNFDWFSIICNCKGFPPLLNKMVERGFFLYPKMTIVYLLHLHSYWILIYRFCNFYLIVCKLNLVQRTLHQLLYNHIYFLWASDKPSRDSCKYILCFFLYTGKIKNNKNSIIVFATINVFSLFVTYIFS